MSSQLHDHGDLGKTMPWQGSVHVPLVVRAPALGVLGNRTARAPATIIDIAATILDYAGVQVPAGMTSRTLRPVLEGTAAANRETISSGL